MEKQKKICDYVSPEGLCCKRTVDVVKSGGGARYSYDGASYCVFHDRTTFREVLQVNERTTDARFKEELKHLIEKRDGNWFGFWLPENFELEDMIIDFPIDMRWCSFKKISLSGISFKSKVDFSKSVFSADASFIKINFVEDAYFDKANFQGSVLFDSCTIFQKQAYMYNCNFSGKTQFNCVFKGKVNLSSTTFTDSVMFKGTRLIIASASNGIKLSINVSGSSSQDTKKSQLKKNPLLVDSIDVLSKVNSRINFLINKITRVYRTSLSFIYKKMEFIQRSAQSISGDEDLLVFDSEVDMQDVEFRQPERTRFHMVNLSRAHIIGTNFRGVNFQSVSWQTKNKRKVIYDEIYIEKSNDKSYKKNRLPFLEEAYRNLRVAFESNKDFSTANDFYIGEMEAKREQKPFLRKYVFSIVALYYWLSRYGTSPTRAILAFCFLVIIHSIITWILVQDASSILKDFKIEVSSVSIIAKSQTISVYLINSLKVLTLQRFGKFIDIEGWQNLLDTTFRIVGPVQLFLIVLSLRTKVKRH